MDKFKEWILNNCYECKHFWLPLGSCPTRPFYVVRWECPSKEEVDFKEIIKLLYDRIRAKCVDSNNGNIDSESIEEFVKEWNIPEEWRL